jgi:hypothetical protein
LSTASELVDSVCDIRQMMSVNYALQFVDVIEKLPIIYVCMGHPLIGGDSSESAIFWKLSHSRLSVSPFTRSGVISFRIFWLLHLYVFWRSGYK